MKISARIAVRGRATEVERGAVMARTTPDTAGRAIEATIPCESVDAPGPKAGDEAHSVVEATAVVIAED